MTVDKYPGCQLICYPKFHCELNFIEIQFIAWAKAHHRSTCTYKYNDLKTGLPVTFDELMPISFVRKAFDYCLRLKRTRRSCPWICYDKIQEPSSPLSYYKARWNSEWICRKNGKKKWLLSAASNIIIKFPCMYINKKIKKFWKNLFSSTMRKKILAGLCRV